MHFLRTVAVGASALISLVAAQSSSLAFTSTPASVTAGKAVTLKYTASNTNDVSRHEEIPRNANALTDVTFSACDHHAPQRQLE